MCIRDSNYKEQIEFFSDNGFEVFVPLMPGYHEDDQELDTYQSLRIAEELSTFINSVTDKPVNLFGHDWGASAAYGIANLIPEKVAKLITASVPYGPALMSAFLLDGDQQRKSWYMFFFQLPIAEISVPMNEYEFIHRLWREWSPDLKDYKKYSNNVVTVLSKSNVLSKALAYYRCSFQGSLQLDRINTKSSELLGIKIKPPCLYFHGQND